MGSTQCRIVKMAQLITPTQDARQTFTTILDNQKVRINLAFLDSFIDNLNNGWYGDLILFTDTEETIVQGQRLESGSALGGGLISDFTGAIIVVPITNPIQDLISIDAWSTTHNLVYFSQDELNDNII